jgi:hyperosmotically inducible protein
MKLESFNVIARSVALLMFVSVGVAFAVPQQEATQEPARQDDTGINKRDRDQSEPTADQQKETRSDRDITQEIRKAIMADKSLSMYAHNVKIIADNGSVTLKGPVRSDDEKRAVETKAAEVAGRENVTSEITVQPEDGSRTQ